MEGDKTAEEISQSLGTDPSLMKKFLNVLVSLGLLSKTGDRYAKTQLSEIFLKKKSPFYQGNLINLVLKNYQEWAKLGEALKGQITQESTSISESSFDKKFILAMAEANMRGPLFKVTEAISGLPEFKNARRLLDLGGGHGLHAIALAQENPQLQGMVFDLPPVVESESLFLCIRWKTGCR